MLGFHKKETEPPLVHNHNRHVGTCAICQQQEKARQEVHIARSIRAKELWKLRMDRMPTL